MNRFISPMCAGLCALLLLSMTWAGVHVRPASAAKKKFHMKCGIATLNDVQVEWAKRFSDRVVRRSGQPVLVVPAAAGQLGHSPVRHLESARRH